MSPLTIFLIPEQYQNIKTRINRTQFYSKKSSKNCFESEKKINLNSVLHCIETMNT